MKKYTICIYLPIKPKKGFTHSEEEIELEVDAINYGHAEVVCREKYPNCKIIEIRQQDV